MALGGAGLIPYDESADAAQLYNPVFGAQAANPVIGARIYPVPGEVAKRL